MRINGNEVPEADPLWKRNIAVFAPSDGDWTEAPQADGSYRYTAGTSGGDLTCEWESGKSEVDKDLPAGTVVTYWPDSGKVRIKKP